MTVAVLLLVGVIAYWAGYTRGNKARLEDLADTIKMVRREMKDDNK